MTDFDSLYRSVKDDLNKLATYLMAFGEQQVKKRGASLPFGAHLTATGEVVAQAVYTGDDPTTSAEVLPLLERTLEIVARDDGAVAVALAEWVTARNGADSQTDAIKVLVHHSVGLAVTFYVPARKTFFHGWTFGATVAQPGAAIVSLWPAGANAGR